MQSCALAPEGAARADSKSALVMDLSMKEKRRESTALPVGGKTPATYVSFRWRVTLGSMRAELERLAEHLGVPLRAESALLAYAQLVQTWNRKLNLVGSTDAAELADVLFADALILADALPEKTRFVDVGAGAGAPAIPLLLLRQDLEGTLVEPRRKRVAFQRTCLGTLGLTDRASAHERRLEGPPLPGSPFDVAMSRATFEPDEWLQRARSLAPQIAVLTVDELPKAAFATLELERRYTLPATGRPRALALYRSAEGAT